MKRMKKITGGKKSLDEVEMRRAMRLFKREDVIARANCIECDRAVYDNVNPKRGVICWRCVQLKLHGHQANSA